MCNDRTSSKGGHPSFILDHSWQCLWLFCIPRSAKMEPTDAVCKVWNPTLCALKLDQFSFSNGHPMGTEQRFQLSDLLFTFWLSTLQLTFALWLMFECIRMYTITVKGLLTVFSPQFLICRNKASFQRIGYWLLTRSWLTEGRQD